MTKEEFDDHTMFVYKEKHQFPASYEDENHLTINFWTVSYDDEIEGEFVNFYSKELIQYLPFTINRPLAYGTNCDRLRIRLKEPYKKWYRDDRNDDGSVG